MIPRQVKILPILAVTTLLSACGGGGGGGGVGDPPPPAANQSPVAAITRPEGQILIAGDNLSASAATSTDPDGDALQYQWALDSKPTGSNAVIAQAGGAVVDFSVDVAGNYGLTVTVSDGKASTSKSVTVLANGKLDVQDFSFQERLGRSDDIGLFDSPSPPRAGQGSVQVKVKEELQSLEMIVGASDQQVYDQTAPEDFVADTVRYWRFNPTIPAEDFTVLLKGQLPDGSFRYYRAGSFSPVTFKGQIFVPEATLVAGSNTVTVKLTNLGEETTYDVALQAAEGVPASEVFSRTIASGATATIDIPIQIDVAANTLAEVELQVSVAKAGSPEPPDIIHDVVTLDTTPFAPTVPEGNL